MPRHPRPWHTVPLPPGINAADVLDRIADLAPAEPEGAMDYCTCEQRAWNWCAICGEGLSVRQRHVRLAIDYHDPRYTVTGRSGPLVAHTACWNALLDRSRERLQERQMRGEPVHDEEDLNHDHFTR